MSNHVLCTLFTSVRRLSMAASSIRYSASLGGPRCRLSTSVAGPSLWNSLPNSLRDPHLGRDSFRRLLKTHLFTLKHLAY